MQYPDRRVFRLALMLLDLCALVLAFQMALETRILLNGFYQFQMTYAEAEILAPPLGLIMLLWIPMSLRLRLYRPRSGALSGTVVQVVESVIVMTILTIVVTFFVRNFGSGYSRTFVLYFAGYSTLTLLASRAALRLGVMVCQRGGRALERIAIAGSGEDAKKLAEQLEAARHAGIRLCGVITTAAQAPQAGVLGNPVPVLGTVSEVGALINTHQIDRIIAVDGEVDRMGLQTLAATCTRMGVRLNRLPASFEMEPARLRVHRLGSLNLLEFHGLQLSRAEEVAKKVFDIVVGSILLATAAPLMLALGVIIKITSPGPVLFVAPRVGKGGRHFPFYKFRSMVADAEARRDEVMRHNEKDGHIFKIKNDPRMTSIGRFMRRFSLDELPQLLNVLKGDMSLVGPRPLPARDLDRDGMSREHAFWARERTRVLPGITGLWQVRGRSRLGFEDMIRHDIAYARDWSIRKDIRILLETLPAVIRGRGAY